MWNSHRRDVHQDDLGDAEVSRVCAAVDCGCSLDGCQHDGRRKPAQARFCSSACASRTKKANYRKRKRRGLFKARHPEAVELLESTDSTSLSEMYDHAGRPDHWDEIERDEDVIDTRTPYRIEQDERFHQLVGQDEERRAPRQPVSDRWRQWRAASKRNPGVEPVEQTQDRIARQKTAYDASMARIDAQVDGRVQDRYDPRTALNPGRNGAASRKLNAHYVDRPPVWTSGDGFRF